MRRLSVCLLACIAVLLIVVRLVGCAERVGDKLDCNRINWYRLGLKDGSQGNYRQKLAKTFPSCGPNIAVDRKQYQVGWAAGVKTYCTPQNAFQLGEAGKMYNNVCPSDKINPFDKAWRAGLRKFCIPQNAYTLGLKGKEFPSICPSESNAELRHSYKLGVKAHAQRLKNKKEIDEINITLAKIRRENKMLHHELRKMRIQYSQQSFSPQTQYHIQKLTLKVKHLTEKETALKAEKQKFRLANKAINLYSIER